MTMHLGRLYAILEGQENLVPESLANTCDATVVVHLIADILGEIGNTQDRPSITEFREGAHHCIELFATHHILRETLSPSPIVTGRRFGLYRDASPSSLVQSHDTLAEAVLNLVIEDVKVVIYRQWVQVFGRALV